MQSYKNKPLKARKTGLNNTQTYQNGMVDGIQRRYYQSGVLQSVVPYSAGVINGTVSLYYPDSTLLAEVEYANGAVVSNKCYTQVGQISSLNAIGLYQLENGMDNITCPYQNENIPNN